MTGFAPGQADTLDPTLLALWDVLPQARLVGGAVRDLIAGVTVADYDLASPLPPEQVQSVLADAGIRTVPTGLAHGTVTAIVDHRPFEITTLRRDLATDGRHADIAWTDDWAEDAARRDFTINAMSLDRAGTLHDHFGGRADLAARRVRFVGCAATRIAEDHLRILRFFRFHARYGGAVPDAEAVAAIAEGAALVDRLSVERVWSETRRLLETRDPRDAVRLMAELGVLQRVFVEGFSMQRLSALVAIDAPADPLLRTAALLDGDAADFAARLRLSGDEARRLDAIRSAPAPRPDADAATLARMLVAAPNAVLDSRTWLAQSAPHDAAWVDLRRRLRVMKRPVFPLAGRDLIARGVPPGKPLGEMLDAVRDWWLADGARADRAACLSALEQVRAGGAAEHPDR